MPGEDAIKAGLIVDYERVIEAYKRLGALMRDFDGNAGPILAEEARDTDKAEHFDPGSDLGVLGNIKVNEGMRMVHCLELKKKTPTGSPSAPPRVPPVAKAPSPAKSKTMTMCPDGRQWKGPGPGGCWCGRELMRPCPMTHAEQEAAALRASGERATSFAEADAEFYRKNATVPPPGRAAK